MAKAAVTITIPEVVALKIVDDIMANYPEASVGNSLYVEKWDYKRRTFTVVDQDADKTYRITRADLLKGFRLMFEPGKWPAGCKFPPACATYDDKDGDNAWERWFQDCDITEWDAFLQLATLGDVVYG